MIEMIVRKLGVEKLPLDGALIINPTESNDERGVFFKLFTEELLKENGISPHFCEQYISISKKGVVRGLHYQAGKSSQAKLVQCIKGEAYDVILDLRRSSPTFGRWTGVMLSEKTRQTIFIPRGFAHGFAALSEGATLHYLADNNYSQKDERGVRWDDPALAIDWKVGKPIVNEKDRLLPLFKDAEYF